MILAIILNIALVQQVYGGSLLFAGQKDGSINGLFLTDMSTFHTKTVLTNATIYNLVLDEQKERIFFTTEKSIGVVNNDGTDYNPSWFTNFPIGQTPLSITLDPKGRYLYYNIEPYNGAILRIDVDAANPTSQTFFNNSAYYYPGFYGPIGFYPSSSLLLLSNTLGVCAISTTEKNALPFYVLVFPFIDINDPNQQTPIVTSITVDDASGQAFISTFLCSAVIQVYLNNGNVNQYNAPESQDGGFAHSNFVYNSPYVYMYGAPYGVFQSLNPGLYTISMSSGQYKLVWKASGYTINSMILLQSAKSVENKEIIQPRLSNKKPDFKPFLNTNLNFTVSIQGPKFWSSEDLYTGYPVPGTSVAAMMYYFNQTYWLTMIESDGTQLWTYEYRYPEPSSNFLQPVFSSDNSTILCNVYSDFVAFNVENGDILWKASFPTSTIWKNSFMTQDNSLIVWTLNTISSLDANTGKTMWSVNTNNYTRWMIINSDTTALYGVNANAIFKMTTNDGKIIWNVPSFFVSDGQLATGALSLDESLLFVGSQLYTGYVAAYYTTNGSIAWNVSTYEEFNNVQPYDTIQGWIARDGSPCVLTGVLDVWSDYPQWTYNCFNPIGNGFYTTVAYWIIDSVTPVIMNELLYLVADSPIPDPNPGPDSTIYVYNHQNQLVQQANYPGYSLYNFALGTDGQFYNAYSFGSSDVATATIIVQASVMPDIQ